jgi:DNA adenine methylase
MSSAAKKIVTDVPKPFLKWAGGKRQLLPELFKTMLGFKSEGHYYEPFIGGGALFFAMRGTGWDGRATLADTNDMLIRTYQGVRNDVESVITALETGYTYSEEAFYAERKRHALNDVWDEVDTAAWVIYINRTCFNGLWRVNKNGRFNVPFGRYTNPTICDAEGLRTASEALRCTKLLNADFERTVKSAETGDLVYFDPPYVPVGGYADFTKYTKEGFGEFDQERLRNCAAGLKKRGVHVMLSNADVPLVRKLYKGFTLREVQAKRNINSRGDGRGHVGELIIT